MSLRLFLLTVPVSALVFVACTGSDSDLEARIEVVQQTIGELEASLARIEARIAAAPTTAAAPASASAAAGVEYDRDLYGDCRSAFASLDASALRRVLAEAGYDVSTAGRNDAPAEGDGMAGEESMEESGDDYDRLEHLRGLVMFDCLWLAMGYEAPWAGRAAFGR